MTQLEEEDDKFIREVIKQNQKGLERLAKEVDAAEAREEKLKNKIKKIFYSIKLSYKKDSKKFSKIEA